VDDGGMTAVEVEEIDFDQPVSCVWSAYGHTFTGTGNSASEDSRSEYESCLTCGAEYVLRNLGGGNGEYLTNNGNEPQECSGRTDLQHGYERHCEADNGRGCADSIESGRCTHTDFDCNCCLCD
jgi:hypothetical protein